MSEEFIGNRRETWQGVTEVWLGCNRTYVKYHEGESSLVVSLAVSHSLQPQKFEGLLLSLHTNLMWWSQKIMVNFVSTFFPGNSLLCLLIEQHYVTC